MALPQSELVTALMTAYRADTTLQGLITGAVSPTWNIFDAVPTNQAFPVVVINSITGSVGTALTMPYGKANDLLVQIDIWSQRQGFKEAQAIASRIDTLTNEQSFSMVDFTNYMTLINNTMQMVEPDGLTRRVMLRYKFYTQG
jgi:hypothetical protein